VEVAEGSAVIVGAEVSVGVDFGETDERRLQADMPIPNKTKASKRVLGFMLPPYGLRNSEWKRILYAPSFYPKPVVRTNGLPVFRQRDCRKHIDSTQSTVPIFRHRVRKRFVILLPYHSQNHVQNDSQKYAEKDRAGQRNDAGETGPFDADIAWKPPEKSGPGKQPNQPPEQNERAAGNDQYFSQGSHIIHTNLPVVNNSTRGKTPSFRGKPGKASFHMWNTCTTFPSLVIVASARV
jgi:hypothetical protein